MPKYNLQLQDSKSLRAYLSELRRSASTLESYIQAISEDGIDALEVRNNTIGFRGLEYVAKFTEAVREAHLDARCSRGGGRPPWPSGNSSPRGIRDQFTERRVTVKWPETFHRPVKSFGEEFPCHLWEVTLTGEA